MDQQRVPGQLNRWLAAIILALAACVLLTSGATAYLWWQRPALGHGAPGTAQVALCAGPSFGNLDLWLADPAGKHRQRLTDTPESEFYPTWSPDGRVLAFARAAPSVDQGNWVPTTGLYCLRFQDGEPVEEPLAPDVAGLGAPSWSPDGQRLAFVAPIADATANAATDSPRAQLVVVDASARQREIIPLPAPIVFDAVSWSPDGNALAFVVALPPQKAERQRQQAGVAAACLYTLGSQQFQIVAHDVTRVAFSPAAPLLACAGQQPGLRLLQADGTEARAILPGDYITGFAWSPDGTTLALGGVTGQQGGELLLYRLADDSTTVIPLEEGRFPVYLAWSPDGRYLSYTCFTEGAREGELNAHLQVRDLRAGADLPFTHVQNIETLATWRATVPE